VRFDTITMDPVDYNDKGHSAAITKALDLLRWPHHCRFTGRAKKDLIKLKLASGDVLDSMQDHLKARLPLYTEMQTMSELEPIVGYIFCPLLISKRDLRIYCKYTLPNVSREKDEYLLVHANHKPDFTCPGEKK